MRSVASALLVIVALLLGTIAGPALWLQRNVVDGPGFVALAGPWGSNSEFQEGLSALVASQATAALNLPPKLNDLAGAVINSAARALHTDPGYGQAWTQTLQRSHKLTFDAAGNTEVQGDLLLDIAPLVDMVAANVSKDIGVPLPTPTDVVVSLQQPQVARLLPAMATLGGASGAMVIAAVVLAALGVAAAKRRARAIILTGLGLAVVALLWQLGSGWVGNFLGGMATGSEAAAQFGSELAVLAIGSWQGGIVATFGIAGIIVAAGVVTLMLGRRHTT